jgi:cytochrome c oxidase subunit III
LSPSSTAVETHAHAAGGELVAHHFEDLEQQRDAGTLGMWFFLGSEVLFFGGVFTAYAMMREVHPSGFRAGSNHLDPVLGGINTAVLLTSSLTMAMAVWSAQTAQRRFLQLFLALTLLFGTAFLGIKGYEWYHEYAEGLLPGATFGTTLKGEPVLGKDPRTGSEYEMTREQLKSMQLFFVFYFTITGLHGLHMLVGLAVLGVQLALALRSNFGVADYGPIEIAGLYWHFVDIVWIFVFPILYLLRS